MPWNMANVAHLVRASGCGSEGSGFDPHHSPQVKYLSCGWDFLLPLGNDFDIGAKCIEAICEVFIAAVDVIHITEN